MQSTLLSRNCTRGYAGRSPLHVLTLLLILLGSAAWNGCDFRDPEEGYDENWNPDHETESPRQLPEQDEGDSRLDVPDDPSGAEVVTDRRPADIIADTAGMKMKDGVWEEERQGSSAYRAYMNGEEPEMIVERTEVATRSYFFNDGILFYYTEESHDGSYDLTVEFDDFGDVRGSQKLRNGRRVPAGSDDYAKIVERASEINSKLKMQN